MKIKLKIKKEHFKKKLGIRDGYTPIKNVDYFDGVDGRTPIKGIDYHDGENGLSADEKKITEEISFETYCLVMIDDQFIVVPFRSLSTIYGK